MLGNIWE